MAHDKGVPVHVFVDETRPRNQGAALTAYELGQHGVPLEVGHLVLAGSFTRVVFARKGDTLHADFGSLGGIAVQFV